MTIVPFSFSRQILIERLHPRVGEQPFQDRPPNGVDKLPRPRQAKEIGKIRGHPLRKVQRPFWDGERRAFLNVFDDHVVVAGHDARPLSGTTSPARGGVQA